MDIMKSIRFFGVAGLLLSMLSGCVSRDVSYVVVEEGRSGLGKTLESSARQWEYARATQESGALKKAERRMLFLIRRWPSCKEAPLAARARADMLLERGELVPAFEAYQFLIDNYSGRMEEYDVVLDKQFTIARKIMERRRMRWMFGGYRSPDSAISYFEDMIRNGPQSEYAAEAQFLIGQSYQDVEKYELAIMAYEILGQRYPDCSFAEDAAWNQIQCLLLLVEAFPRNPELRNRLLTSSTLFNATYPRSEHADALRTIRNELYETCAAALYDTATFYVELAKKPEAARVYDEALIQEYPMSQLVPKSEARLATLPESSNDDAEEQP